MPVSVKSKETNRFFNLQVEPDGSYVRPPAAKVSYGAMVKTRVGIVVLSAWHLSKAITIAVRYSIVRKQGQLTDG